MRITSAHKKAIRSILDGQHESAGYAHTFLEVNLVTQFQNDRTPMSD